MEKTILVVDDEVNILEMIRYNLEKEHYRVLVTDTGEKALELLNKEPIDLAVLDLMLPGIDGLSLLKHIRSSDALKDLPVLLLTAKDAELDKVVGLELGADDYLTKPFSLHELQARIKALLRRLNRSVNNDTKNRLAFGDIVVDRLTHQVFKNGQSINLAPKEFNILVVFAQNLERVFTRDELLLKIWGTDFLGESRTVDVHIKNLRKKIEDNPEEPVYIRTVRGVGYKLVDRDWSHCVRKWFWSTVS